MPVDPGHDEGRPGERAPLNVNNDDIFSVPGANLACQIAELRVEAERMRSVWLACQLRDFADLLEVAERERWFG
jgi:hypothetical protein